LAGPAASCTAPAGPTFQCFDGVHAGIACSGLEPDPACGNVPKACNATPHCYFGPPLTIPNPVNPATNTCVLNVIDTAPSGTADVGSGAVTISMSLRSHVYLTASNYGATTSCPRCLLTVGGFKCNAGARAGQPCTVGSPTTQTSTDCLPNVGEWAGPLG